MLQVTGHSYHTSAGWGNRAYSAAIFLKFWSLNQRNSVSCFVEYLELKTWRSELGQNRTQTSALKLHQIYLSKYFWMWTWTLMNSEMSWLAFYQEQHHRKALIWTDHHPLLQIPWLVLSVGALTATQHHNCFSYWCFCHSDAKHRGYLILFKTSGWTAWQHLNMAIHSHGSNSFEVFLWW